MKNLQSTLHVVISIARTDIYYLHIARASASTMKISYYVIHVVKPRAYLIIHNTHEKEHLINLIVVCGLGC